MSDQKTSTLLALSLLFTPIAVPAVTPSRPQTISPSTISETTPRASVRRMKHQLATAPLLQAKGTYVGELQERWQFPSDHLPIAMTYDDLHIASWNVLDAGYMSWVTEKNSQGLSRSLIKDEHIYIGDSKLTIRDIHTADLVLEMISHPTHPRSILSLQECSKPFLEELTSRLSGSFEVVEHHGNAILFDRSRFELVNAKEVLGVFTNEPKRSFQEICLRRIDNGENFKLFNVHLPGDPTKPGRFEFAQYIKDTFDSNCTTVAMGDMNFNELEMADAMRQAFPDNSPFSIYSPYCTNISPYVFNSKAIDHFIISTPNQSLVTLNSPDQVMTKLEEVVSLLERL